MSTCAKHTEQMYDEVYYYKKYNLLYRKITFAKYNYFRFEMMKQKKLKKFKK